MRNGAHETFALHAWHQILRLVDRLGEAVEARAFAEKFRAHGYDDMRRAALRAIRDFAREQADESFRFLPARLLGEAEQLLELIDQNAKARIG